MENLIREADPVQVRKPGTSRRATSIFAAIALVLGGVALAARTDSSVPKTKVVTNVDGGKAVVDGAGAVLGRTLGFRAAQPQIDVPGLIRAIVCPILARLGAAFAGFPIVVQVINRLRAAFGCISL